MPKEIRIVNVGKYVGAVKQGRCPMYAITTQEKRNDMIKGLCEDFPEYRIVDGSKPDRAMVAQFIIKTNSR